MFCRELCEVVLFKKREKLGGPGKIVEIDESKIGKRKYHRGQVVEGQWVFGRIEVHSRKCFIVTVEDRTEATLIAHIQDWIEPGTTIIVSDCWKGCINLAKYGYEHKTVNHSVELSDEDGYYANKTEGQWRQLRVHQFCTDTGGKRNIMPHISRNLFGVKDLFRVFLKDVACVYKIDQLSQMD